LLSQFRTPVSPESPGEYKKADRSLLGRGDWLKLTLRLDAHPAFTFLASQIANNLTAIVWSAILRWAHYLACTPDLVLTCQWEEAPSAATMEACADASLENGTDSKLSQVFKLHNSKSSQCMQAKKLCVCVLGFEVLLLRFLASGWADIRIIPLSFPSLIVVCDAPLWNS
jgi:hypothetical protein